MIGEELRAVRLKRGLSARKVTTAAGISPSTLTAIESGARYPSLRTLETLAKCLRVSIVIGPDETTIEPFL
jgi:transcriptional regulator with XRE-family HTH domain